MQTLPGSHGRLSRRPHTAAIAPVVPEPQVPWAFLFNGPPSAGKTAQAERLAQLLGGHAADIGKRLSELSDTDKNVAQAIQGGVLADSRTALKIIVEEVGKANGGHVFLVGVRSEWQIYHTYQLLKTLGYGIFYIDLKRSFEDCVRLARRRERHDDNIIEARLERFYTGYGPEMLSFFNRRKEIPQLHYDLGECADKDALNILRQIQEKNPSIKEWRSEPDPVLSQ